MSSKEDEPALCEDWELFWIKVSLGIVTFCSTLSFGGGILLLLKLLKSSLKKQTLLRWIALCTILAQPFNVAGSMHQLLVDAQVDGWNRCDLMTWSQEAMMLIALFYGFQTAANGYILLVGFCPCH